MLNKILFALIVGAAFILPQSEAADAHERGNWYIGFGLGAGLDARYSTDQYSITFDDVFNEGGVDKSPKLAVNFKAGVALSPETLLGFDFTAVKEASITGTTEKETVNGFGVLGGIGYAFALGKAFTLL